MKKRHLDYCDLDYIITEYLGLSKEYLNMVDVEEIVKNVKYIINNYNNVDYMLIADFEVGRASDNFDKNTSTYLDIEVLDNINGIIVYKYKEVE